MCVTRCVYIYVYVLLILFLWRTLTNITTHYLTQFISVVQPCLTLCDPMDCSMPGLPVYQQLQEFTQTQVRWVGDAILASRPLSPLFCLQYFPVSGSFPMSQLFAWGGQNIGVSASASVLPMNSQDWSPLGWTDWISLHPRDSQECSPTRQFQSITS